MIGLAESVVPNTGVHFPRDLRTNGKAWGQENDSSMNSWGSVKCKCCHCNRVSLKARAENAKFGTTDSSFIADRRMRISQHRWRWVEWSIFILVFTRNLLRVAVAKPPTAFRGNPATSLGRRLLSSSSSWSPFLYLPNWPFLSLIWSTWLSTYRRGGPYNSRLQLPYPSGGRRNCRGTWCILQKQPESE